MTDIYYSGSLTSDNKKNYYDKTEVDENFVSKTTQINGHSLSNNITLTASDIGALAENINIPTKLSDLTDDLGTNPTHTHSQYLTEHQDITGKQDVLTAGNNISITNNIISAEAPTILPRFSINNGNKNNKGNMDILSYSGQTLSFKVDDGTLYQPFTCTDGYSGSQYEKTSLDTVSTTSLSEAIYNVFIPKTGNQPYLLNNVIFVQAEKPSDTPTDTIPVMRSNSSPYGTVSSTGLGNRTNNAYDLFNPTGYVYSANGAITGSITYTFDENYQPQAGTYQVQYTAISTSVGVRGKITSVKVYYDDSTSTTITRTGDNQYTSFSQNITATGNIIKIEANYYLTQSNAAKLGYLQLLKPAILDEGTLWVNNGVEPLEVQARDSQGQWQPFYDVLAGTCTVNSSHNITAVTNIGFNYFSTVNMHNISTTAHKDIREQITELEITMAGKQDVLTGLTASVTELNYCDGVTSNIQEQLNALAQRITALEPQGE